MAKHAQATQASIERSRLATERDLLAVKTQLVALRKDLEAGLAQAKTDLQAGLAQAKTDLLAVKTELLEGQLAAAELIEAKTALLEVKETMKAMVEEMVRSLDTATRELAEANTALKAATVGVTEEMATARAMLRLDLVSDLGTSVVASANWIARRHNSHRDAVWQELAADGPDSDSFKIGAVDGSAINTAAPLGHKPAHDHELWFPRNSAELQEATVEQVDALLFFYAIPDPRDPTKQFGAATPLLQKIATLGRFLSH
jgi:hypothetical protein